MDRGSARGRSASGAFGAPGGRPSAPQVPGRPRLAVAQVPETVRRTPGTDAFRARSSRSSPSPPGARRFAAPRRARAGVAARGGDRGGRRSKPAGRPPFDSGRPRAVVSRAGRAPRSTAVAAGAVPASPSGPGRPRRPAAPPRRGPVGPRVRADAERRLQPSFARSAPDLVPRDGAVTLRYLPTKRRRPSTSRGACRRPTPRPGTRRDEHSYARPATTR